VATVAVFENSKGENVEVLTDEVDEVSSTLEVVLACADMLVVTEELVDAAALCRLLEVVVEGAENSVDEVVDVAAAVVSGVVVDEDAAPELGLDPGA